MAKTIDPLDRSQMIDLSALMLRTVEALKKLGNSGQPLGAFCQSIQPPFSDDGDSRIESLLPRTAPLTRGIEQ